MKKHIANAAALVNTGKAKLATGAALVMAGIGSAHATETSAAEAAFQSLQAEADSMAGYAWPVVAAIVGSLLAIGLFKKFANKAT